MIGQRTRRRETLPADGKAGAPRFWLLTRREGAGQVALTLDLPGGGEALPVFSFEEEARMFLRLGRRGGGWRVRESRAGELVSLLSTPYAGVRRVALDPLPEDHAGVRLLPLLCLGRESFVRTLIEGGPGRSARWGRGNPARPPRASRDDGSATSGRRSREQQV